MKLSKSNFPLIYSNRYNLGFEVECIDTSDSYDSKFKDGLQKIQKNVDIGEDSSITGGGEGMEIRTVPQKSFKSVQDLYYIFELMKKHNITTNSSCGLHVNVSPVSKTNYHNINPFYIRKHKLWEQIKKDFKRNKNTYCVPINKKTLSPFKIWTGIMDRDLNLDIDDSHYNCVNFENYYDRPNKESRIEVRCFGNKDYEKKFDLVVKNIEKSLKVIDESYKVREI